MQSNILSEESTMASRPRLPSTRIVTPKGLAHFAYVNKPDTEGQYSDGKYKITVSFPADSDFVKTLEEKVNALLTEQYGDRVPRNAHSPVRFGDDTTMEAMAGRVFIRAKTAKQPVVVDAQKQALPEGLTVFGGDTVKVAMTLAVYEAGASKGVTAYLDAIQLIEKRNAGGSGADMFGIEDGFVAEASAASPADSFDDDDDDL
jgi:hypothetical protein